MPEISRRHRLIKTLGRWSGRALGMAIMLTAQGMVWASQPEAGGTKVPTLLPIDDTSVGGDPRYCTGLARMIQEGDISLRNIPCFIKFFSETIIAFAGTLAVLFVIYGGFRYVVSGYTEDKESAKKTITYSLIGLAVSLLAWVIVDVVLQIATE